MMFNTFSRYYPDKAMINVLAGDKTQMAKEKEKNDDLIKTGVSMSKSTSNVENIQMSSETEIKQETEVLENTRKSFQDKELKNEYVYKELRDKIAEGWKGATNQMVPGIPNIDLISSDEHILSLIRDGFKYRDRPKTRSAGSSIAALTNRKSSANLPSPRAGDNVSDLREKAKSGDKKSADNLLVAQLNRLRSARRG